MNAKEYYDFFKRLGWQPADQKADFGYEIPYVVYIMRVRELKEPLRVVIGYSNVKMSGNKPQTKLVSTVWEYCSYIVGNNGELLEMPYDVFTEKKNTWNKAQKPIEWGIMRTVPEAMTFITRQ